MPARRFAAALLVVSLLAPAGAEAFIAREPLIRVLRQASPELVACRERHHLADGRYLVRLTIDWTGKVVELELGESPEDVSPAAESCIAAAFTHLRFASWERPPPAVETVQGPERRSVVPPDLRSGHRRTPGFIVVAWPFLFAP